MSLGVPNGASVYLAKTYEEPVAVIAVTNATDTIFKLEIDHGIVANDIVQITSGWQALNDLVAKVTEATTDSITLGTIDTSDTNRFVVGGGVGSVRKVSGWIEVPQITELASSGGEQQSIPVQTLSDVRQRNINTFKAPQVQTLTIAHDSTLPIYPFLEKSDASQETLAAYMYVPNAKEGRYWSVKVSFNNIPATAINTVETVTAVFNLQSQSMIFYKSNGNVPVTGVSMNKNSLSLEVGNAETLSASIQPVNASNKNGTWTSSAPAKASVNAATGLVTAVSAGSAIITYTTADGAKLATCSVTVTA